MIWLLACTRGEDTAVQDHLTAVELRAVTEQILAIGPRMSGTPEEEAALRLMESLFVDAGLSAVRAEPFDWELWSRVGDSSLQVDGSSFPAMAWSPSPNGQLAGELAVDEVEGKVALTRSGEMGRSEAFLSAWLGGAIGLVHISEDLDAEDGSDLVEVGHTLDVSTLPALAVSAATGEGLQAGDTVTLDIGASLRPHTSWNVLGMVEGSGEGGPVFVTAHYDSWDNSECAFDNGMGAAGLVLLARQLVAGPQPRRDVIFLAAAGEEQGVQGSQAWVRDNEALARSGVLVLNLDVMWSAEGSYWINADASRHTELGMQVAEEEGLSPRDGGAPSPSSDHLAFQGRSVPAFWATRQPDRHYHTTHDRLEFLDLEQSAAALRVNWALLAAEAGL